MAATLGGCDPYDRFGKNNDHLGPVDPVTFPPANLGVGGNRMQAGRGAFTETRAYVGGMPVGYFPYAVAAGPMDPLRVTQIPARPAYQFTDACVPPAGYVWDEMTSPINEDHRKDQAWPVFTALPSATYTPGVAVTSTYVPVVAEKTVAVGGRPCQAFKSETQIVETFKKEMNNSKFVAGDIKPTGKFFAWMLIDPAAAVYPLGQSANTMHPGLGLQKWGWYNRYLAAYLDGGEIATATSMIMEGMPPAPVTVTRMVTQRLFYPRSMVTGMNAAGMPTMAPGARGAGYDVLEFKKGDPGYSPVCRVFTYDTVMPMAAADLPKDVATIEMMFNGMPPAEIRPATPALVYCLQVR